MLRCPSPRDSWYARITDSPAYSPAAPLFGCNDAAAKPVILHKSSSSSLITVKYPSTCLNGANGCTDPNSGHVSGIMLLVELSFMVQLPSEIMLCARPRSLEARWVM